MSEYLTVHFKPYFMLKMKSSCERCRVSLTFQDDANICSYECTFCSDCSSKMNDVCPNCNGELVARPKRRTNPVVENRGYSA